MLRRLRRLVVGGIWLWALLPLVPLHAQTAGIVYAEGGDFSVIRRAEQSTYDVAYDDVLGLPLEIGDLVQTGNGTFLEIEIGETGALFRVAENTSFVVEHVDADGSSRFDLSYGRIRTKVETVAAGTFLEMRGLSVVAGVRGTDFGYDLIVTSGGSREPVLQIYAFDGSVVVAEAPAATSAGVSGGSVVAGSVTQATIQSGQMISIPISAVVSGNAAESLAKPPSTITPEIRGFWDAHPFKSIPGTIQKIAQPPAKVLPVPTPEPEAPAIEPLDLLPAFAFPPLVAAVEEAPNEAPEEPEEEPEEESAEEVAEDDGPTGEGWKRAGLGMAVMGAAVTLTGVAMYYALDLVDVPSGYEPSISPGITLMIGGGGLVVGGLASYLTGSIISNR